MKNYTELDTNILLTEINNGNVTYKGTNMKLDGFKINVKGREYFMPTDKFLELGGVKKMKFNASFRKSN